MKKEKEKITRLVKSLSEFQISFFIKTRMHFYMHPYIYYLDSLMLACAAAKRAIGTR